MTITRLTDGYCSFHLENASGFSVDILNFGGIIQKITLPNGQDVVLGYDTPQEYLCEPHYYFGAMIGQNANRIDNGTFVLGDKCYQLEQNNAQNNLHSGSAGFHGKLFDHRMEGESLILSAHSPHLEGGFPGDVSVEICYKLTEKNGLSIQYNATTSQETVVNLTNHTYFNLNGQGTSCLDHKVQINAECFTVNNEDLIPTGEIRVVEGTSLDFRTKKSIKRDFLDPFLSNTRGYDHNFIINHEKERKVVALAEGKVVRLTVESDCPCMQFYTGNFIEGHKGKNGVIYSENSGFCFETGVYPNANNNPEFPPSLLKKGETWQYETVFHFDVL